MIGYRISKTRLEELIEKEAPGWLKKAASKTEELRTKGYYDEKKSIWSAVKAVYMRLRFPSSRQYIKNTARPLGGLL
jgi:hypothetical protein